MGAGALARWQKCLLAYAGLLLFMLTGLQRVLGRVPKQGIELFLGGLLLTAFARHPVFSRTLRALGSRATFGALGLVALVIAVDAAHLRVRWLYPLVGWEMFTSAVGHAADPEQFRYTAHYADGSAHRIVPGETISDAVVSGLDGEATQTLGAFGQHPADARAKAAADAMLRGFALMQERAEPGKDVTSLEVNRCRMPVQAPYVPDCRPLIEVSTP
jgi:hypothetical protein